MSDWNSELPEDMNLDEMIPLSTDSVVTVSEDRMECYLNLASPENGIPYEVSDVVKLLNDNDVKQGINLQTIQEMITSKNYFKNVLVASGKVAEDGKDGFYTFFFRTEMPVLPKIQDDGSVDYKNMDLFEEVEKNQLLAEYTKATTGKYGYTVFGELLNPRKGRELPPLHGVGFTLSQDRKQYFSALTGRIEYKKNRIEVKNLYIVDGNVDVTTGNINFSGDVCIRGNVAAGFQIHAAGNIVVEGHVESAEIYSEKSILLKKGNQGRNTGIIHAKGSVSGMFFESVLIRAGGTVNANYLLNCDVTTEDKVVVAGKKGLVIGGTVRARGGISCFGLGNIAEIPTKVEIGVGDEQMQRYHELANRILKVDSEISLFEDGTRKVTLSPVQDDRTKSMYEKLMQAHMMKQEEKEKYFEERRRLIKVIADAKNAKVIVRGIVYPGVQVMIDTTKYSVTTAYRAVTFLRNGDKVQMMGDDV